MSESFSLIPFFWWVGSTFSPQNSAINFPLIVVKTKLKNSSEETLDIAGLS